jgi:hypothetical protein
VSAFGIGGNNAHAASKRRLAAATDPAAVAAARCRPATGALERACDAWAPAWAAGPRANPLTRPTPCRWAGASSTTAPSWWLGRADAVAAPRPADRREGRAIGSERAGGLHVHRPGLAVMSGMGGSTPRAGVQRASTHARGSCGPRAGPADVPSRAAAARRRRRRPCGRPVSTSRRFFASSTRSPACGCRWSGRPG